tara:strand:- start:383 stop:925 length:543 start_codon:yes stop_codon:yes gene_type:complete
MDDQTQQQPESKKLNYFTIAIMWWLHPINVLIYFLIFTTGILTIGAFSYAVGLERDALRMVLGDDMAISHKKTLFRGYGYRIVRERDTPGEKYSPGEVLVNVESRQRVHEVREGERFHRAARVGAVKAKADRYSSRDRYTDRAVEHLHDKGLAKANDGALDLGYESDGKGNRERLILNGP